MSALLTIPPGPSTRRIIVIGDIHGCYDELVDLLDKVAPRDDDVVVSVGDMVLKGPHSERCLTLWRERGYLAVIGNNEEKAIERGACDQELLDWIATWPVAIDFPEEKVTVVHGGFLPGMTIDEETIAANRRDIIRMRWIRETGDGWKRVPKGEQTENDILWPTVWNGERLVFYGHTPLEAARFDRNAVGIDTGCVYGGMLTAVVHSGETDEVVTVKAKRAYASR